MDNRFWKLLTIILSVLFFVSMVFLFVFGIRLAKNNTIKTTEVKEALTKQEKALNKSFQEEREKTTTKYTAEDIFGGFEFNYPKVWSTNIKRGDADPQLRFFADPGLIVMRDEQGPEVALRIYVYTGKYAEKVKSAESEIKSRKLSVKVEEVTLSGLTGKRFTGKTKEGINNNRSYVYLPLREKTLYIGTDNYDLFGKQFDSILNSFKISR